MQSVSFLAEGDGLVFLKLWAGEVCLRRLVDFLLVALAYGDDGYEDHIIVHAIDQPISGAAQFDFVAVRHT